MLVSAALVKAQVRFALFEDPPSPQMADSVRQPVFQMVFRDQ